MDEPSRLSELKLVCRRDALRDGGPAVRFDIQRNGQPMAAFAISFAGKIHAWVNVCPHRGTSLDWQPGEVFDDSGLYLICATHGALFEPETGLCVEGPCRGASLTMVPVHEHEGDVRLTRDFRVAGLDSD